MPPEKKEAGIANLSCKTLHHAVDLKDLWASSYEVGIWKPLQAVPAQWGSTPRLKEIPGL
jgi:hypothetical protein